MPQIPEAARPKTTLVIACGALARELVAVIRANRFDHLQVACLPAILHNRPERIAPAVRDKIRANRDRFDHILCLYGDCGTGGELDRVLAEEGVERIAGAHCYEFFMGRPDFEALTDVDPTIFFLTDYLVRHFDRLVIQGLGLDRFPELLPIYFGNYTRLVYLAQVDDAELTRRAEVAAARLGLSFERRLTGMGALDLFLLPGNEKPLLASPSSAPSGHRLPEREKAANLPGPSHPSPPRGEGGAQRRMRGRRRERSAIDHCMPRTA